jgi:AcrR family transcriptional regulator
LKQIKNISTEEKILEASKGVFMKYGLYGSRMRDIADAANVNPALLHYYFSSKEKIFDKVFEGAMAKYFQQMAVFSDSSLPIKQRVLNYIDNIIDFYTEYPQMSMFIIKEISINPDLFKQKVNVVKNAKVSLIGLLEEGIKKGEIKKIDTALFLINLQSLCS